jgi:hypothetical protein
MTTHSISANQIEELRKVLARPKAGVRARNQRLAVRYELQARVEFCWMDEKGVSRHGLGRTRDISTKGAYIVGAVRPPRGTLVAMNIVIPLSGAAPRALRVQTEGRVVRVEPGGGHGDAGGFSVANQRVTSFGA